MKKLSIIIPVFNVEDYLTRCINSVINQTVSSDFFDIIIVNDGSSDSSFSIAKNFSNKFSNIFLFNQENKGLSRARNRGIVESNSKYICFLDADDEYEKNAVEIILKTIEKFNSQVLMFNLSKHINVAGEFIRDDSISILGLSILRNEKIASGREFLRKSTYNDGIVSMVLDRTFIVSNNLFFRDNIIYEDLDLIYKIIFKADSFVSLKSSFYKCRIRPNSITRNNDIQKKIKSIQDMKIVLSEMKIFIKNIKKMEPKIEYFFNQKINILLINMLYLFKTIEADKSIRREFISNLNNLDLYPVSNSFYIKMPYLTRFKYLVKYSKLFYIYI
jgi:glycosyltransferase involved in cell wall biosynthesis